MDNENDRAEEGASSPSYWVEPAKPKGGRMVRIAIGAPISFAVLSLLYGINQAATMVGLAVICTAGVGLIPLVFGSWMVGWIVIAAWQAISTPRVVPSAS